MRSVLLRSPRLRFRHGARTGGATGFTGQSLPALTLDPDSVSADRRRLVVARRPAEINAKAVWRIDW
jgi:hypothetical protein